MTMARTDLEGHRWVGGALVRKHCVPCEGGVERLAPERAAYLLDQLPAWSLAREGTAIQRHVRFDTFPEALAFVAAVGWLAHGEGHHPDIELYYCDVRIAYRTHAVDGLTENDFICAALVDDLVPRGAAR